MNFRDIRRTPDPGSRDQADSDGSGAPAARVRVGARVAYLIIIWLATLSDIYLDPEPSRILNRLSRVLAPEVSARDAIDGARNAILFAGWGLVWMLTAPITRRASALRGAVLTGVGVSASVELVQLLSWTRTPSVLDLATNAGGALLGAGLVVLVDRVMAARRRSSSWLGLPTLVLAVSYGLACFGEAFVPLFRQTPLPDVYGGPVARLAGSMAAFVWSSALSLPWMDLPLFLPAGFLAVAALSEEGVGCRTAATWTALAGFAAMIAIEIGHGVLGLAIQVGSIAVHAAAIAGGAFLAVRALPALSRWTAAQRARLALAVYAGVLLLWFLRPYVPVTQAAALASKLRSEWWIPLELLSVRGDVYSVVDIANGFLLHLPLGALMAVWPVRRVGWLRGVLPAVYLGAGAELLQLMVVDRTTDVTDMLVNAAGAVVGWALLRRAGFQAVCAAEAAGARRR